MDDDLGARPLTYAEARSAGVSLERLRGEGFNRLRRNCYVPAGAEVDVVLAARAWMAILPESAAMFGLTAAWWYDLPLQQVEDFHVIVPAGGSVPRRRPGLCPHEGLLPGQAQVLDELRVTTPERTWLDLSAMLARAQLVVAGDAMVRKQLTTPERLVEAADVARGRRHIVQTRKIARLVRPGVDSPPETQVRLILVDGGLPCPETNPHVFDDVGGWIGQPDLGYVELKIAIQYEGDVHRTSQKRWRADVARDEAFAEAGWIVIRVTAHDLRYPERLRQRVWTAINRRRAGLL